MGGKQEEALSHRFKACLLCSVGPLVDWNLVIWS